MAEDKKGKISVVRFKPQKVKMVVIPKHYSKGEGGK